MAGRGGRLGRGGARGAGGSGAARGAFGSGGERDLNPIQPRVLGGTSGGEVPVLGGDGPARGEDGDERPKDYIPDEECAQEALIGNPSLRDEEVSALGDDSGTEETLPLIQKDLKKREYEPSADEESSPAKKTKEEADEDMPDLLTIPKEMLLKIIRKLDPKSFFELALSCRALFDLCRNSRGIGIILRLNHICVYDFEERSRLEGLRNWPVRVHVHMVTTESRLMEEINEAAEWLQTIRVERIGRAQFLTFPSTLETAIQIKTMLVEPMEIEMVHFAGQSEVTSPVLEELLTWQLDILEASCGIKGNAHLDSLLSCEISFLNMNLRVTFRQIKELFKLWMSAEDLESWTFEYNLDSGDISELFADYEILPYNYTGPSERNKKRVFMRIGYQKHTSFYMRNDRGRVISLRLSHEEIDDLVSIGFYSVPDDEIPLALRGL